MNEFDVLVVGAGPAGSLAAIAAARAGARVLLADRAEFPRQKVCGCCLSAEALAALADHDAADAADGAVPLRTVRLVSAGRELAVRRDAGAALSRAELDARLAERARRTGAEVRTGCQALPAADGTWSVGGTAVRARCAVVADGLAGRTLDALPGFGWQVTRQSRMGFGALLPAGAVRCPAGEVRMHVVPGGYVGAVLLPCGSVDVAAAADPAAVRDAGGPAAFASHALGDAVRDRGAFRAAAWRGTPTLTRRRTRVAAEGIIVAGDAASYVEPFTGEGMGWAMRTGAAAGALAARVSRGDASCADWPDLHRRTCRPARVRCRAISLLLRSPSLVRAAIAAGAAMPRLAESIAGRIGRPAVGA
jgi:flavin-dependent dehydrogenase